MRLFVAVDPSPEAREHLRSAVSELDGLRFTRPENWHITLAFLGEVGASTTTQLEPQLESVAAAHPPVELCLAGAGAFGGTLWVGVRGDLAPLAMAVAAAARGCGIALETRGFQAHLTVARSDRGRRPTEQQRELSSYAGPAWTCRELRLVRSHLGTPVQHETVATWPLGAG
jgi:2'-5' RNA ligase